MLSNSYPLIAREGWAFILLYVTISIILYVIYGDIVLPFCSLPLILLLFLLRDPAQNIPAQPLAVLSPVCGQVMLVEKAEDVRIHRDCLRVQIQMRWFDVFSLRSPVEGKVMEQWFDKMDGYKKCRHFDFWVKTDENDDFVVAVRLRNYIPKFYLYTNSGERIGQGQRTGYFFLGGLIDVFLPLNSNINVEVGQNVISGNSIIAQLNHNEMV